MLISIEVLVGLLYTAFEKVLEAGYAEALSSMNQLNESLIMPVFSSCRPIKYWSSVHVFTNGKAAAGFLNPRVAVAL